ncbi:S8 family serine peptidase [Nonomuraea sediminis]|uniref:S8 family serine peptidase n=1 Tax=Nonomuraea sediminis TaxID=2835864 RepID=UPI001BDD3354|nr:S8 family serine peptidase [Nonomuraea sediminis]
MNHLILALVLALGGTPAPVTQSPQQVILVLRDQADPGTVKGPTRHLRGAAIVRALRAKAGDTQRGLLARARARAQRVQPLWIVNAVAVTATPAVIAELAARPEVKQVLPDTAYTAPALAPATAPAQPNLAHVRAPDLWSLGLRGHGVTVAELDTGVDATHPDLAGRNRGWYDPNGEHPTVPTDVSGHGTQVMGVMAGANGYGVAPEASWMAAKIFNDRGTATTSGIHLAMQWLLDPDGDPATADAPDVVNASWTGASGGCLTDFQPDLRALRAAGIQPVFAAGNFGPSPGSVYSPANLPEALAVGAADGADVLAADSGRGPSACAGATAPHLVAPGVDVTTTDLYGGYATVTGTSVAAPHVAGTLALLLGAYPDLDPGRQSAALEHGATDLAPAGVDPGTGYGRLDALAAYQWLASAPDFTFSAAPATRTALVGASAPYTATIGAMNGFTGTVTPTVTGLPAGASATWTPATVTGSGTTQLTVATPACVAPGSYPLTLGAASGPLSHAYQVTLVVTPSDYAISAAPATLSVSRGGSATATITTSGAYPGTVTLTATGLPAASTASFTTNPIPVPATSRITIRTTSSTPRGTFTIRVTGTSSPLTHTATLSLTVR